MKVIIGFLIIAFGVIFGMWAGIWWAFIGGVIDIIREFLAPAVDLGNVAFGVLKIMLSGLIGYLSAFVICSFGFMLIASDS